MIKLNASELRKLDEKYKLKKRNPIPVIFILENIYDTYNVGGIFRLADALNIEKIILTGDTETPPNHKIKKASIGTYKIVPWEYEKTTNLAITKLRKSYKNTQIFAIEQSDKSIPYLSFNANEQILSKMVFIVGNETSGISENTLTKCDKILEIPMFGINRSLNVIVSLAIVTYHIILNTIAVKIKPKAIVE